MNNMPLVHHTTLSNGIRVATQEMPYLHSATIGIQVTNGSRNEQFELHGAAHFVEHLLFKGTQRRSSQQISAEFDRLGASPNATTDLEDVTYYATSQASEIPAVLDILADMYLNATFPADEVEMERKVVKEEIRMSHDNPGRHLSKQFMSGIWSGSPLEHPVLGSFETIDAVTRDQLIQFKQDHYSAGNTIVTAAGNLKHEEVVRLVEQQLGHMPATASLPQKPASTEWQPSLGVARHNERELEQIQFFLGYRTPGGLDPDRQALLLMSQILGGSMNSRLFQEVREQRGLAYSIGTSEIITVDEGILAISCGTSPAKAQEAADLCHAILIEMASSPVNDERLADAKRLTISRLLRGLDQPERQIFRLAYTYDWFGCPRCIEDHISLYQRLDATKLQQAAQQILSYGKPRLESIGGDVGLQVPS